MTTFVKPLRCKGGRIKHFVIDATGYIALEDGSEYPIPRRLAGKKKQYEQVQLMRHGTLRWYYVHILVCCSWHGPPPHRMRIIVDHIDGNSLNNEVSNLRWVTIRANNLNTKCRKLYSEAGVYYPKICGFVHHRYGCKDEDLAHAIRENLVQSYIRYNCRYPENGNAFPHRSIHIY